MKNIIFILLAIIFLFFPKNVFAYYDPRGVANNKFGIHITDENDISDAAELVNSTGGDYGYVTFVIQESDRNLEKWQITFDKLREKHIIPIVRIASGVKGNSWNKLSVEDIDNWINFLNSINWIIENRYVIVGNEPNHAAEWGGKVNPEEYVQYFVEFSKKAKEKSMDFFILPAALDASAPNGRSTISEEQFLSRMQNENPQWSNYVDGWASHSYPNPNFSGSPEDLGKGTVRTFEWELSYLKNLGIQKDLPVFITETGWAHNLNGERYGLIDTAQIGDLFIKTFDSAWNNENIVAITPFLLNYLDSPFDIFSWKDKSGVKYDFYEKLKDYPKQRGEPRMYTTGFISNLIYPVDVAREKSFSMLAGITNTGQTIWDEGSVEILSSDGCINTFYENNDIIFPFKKDNIYMKAKAGNVGFNQLCVLNIYVDGEKISPDYTAEISVSSTPDGYLSTTKTDILISLIRFFNKIGHFFN